MILQVDVDQAFRLTGASLGCAFVAGLPRQGFEDWPRWGLAAWQGMSVLARPLEIGVARHRRNEGTITTGKW